METKNSQWQTPSIILTLSDYERLSNLAYTVADRTPGGCEALFSELDRAVLVADGSLSTNVVRMGSTVTYKTEAGDARTVTLVFPGDADISDGKISVLTPVGTALLGLSTGQSITWNGRDGRPHQLTVFEVEESQSPSRPARPARHSPMVGV